MDAFLSSVDTLVRDLDARVADLDIEVHQPLKEFPNEAMVGVAGATTLLDDEVPPIAFAVRADSSGTMTFVGSDKNKLVYLDGIAVEYSGGSDTSLWMPETTGIISVVKSTSSSTPFWKFGPVSGDFFFKREVQYYGKKDDALENTHVGILSLPLILLDSDVGSDFSLDRNGADSSHEIYGFASGSTVVLDTAAYDDSSVSFAMLTRNEASSSKFVDYVAGSTDFVHDWTPGSVTASVAVLENLTDTYHKFGVYLGQSSVGSVSSVTMVEVEEGSSAQVVTSGAWNGTAFQIKTSLSGVSNLVQNDAGAEHPTFERLALSSSDPVTIIEIDDGSSAQVVTSGAWSGTSFQIKTSLSGVSNLVQNDAGAEHPTFERLALSSSDPVTLIGGGSAQSMGIAMSFDASTGVLSVGIDGAVAKVNDGAMPPLGKAAFVSSAVAITGIVPGTVVLDSDIGEDFSLDRNGKDSSHEIYGFASSETQILHVGSSDNFGLVVRNDSEYAVEYFRGATQDAEQWRPYLSNTWSVAKMELTGSGSFVGGLWTSVETSETEAVMVAVDYASNEATVVTNGTWSSGKYAIDAEIIGVDHLVTNDNTHDYPTFLRTSLSHTPLDLISGDEGSISFDLQYESSTRLLTLGLNAKLAQINTDGTPPIIPVSFLTGSAVVEFAQMVDADCNNHFSLDHDGLAGSDVLEIYQFSSGITKDFVKADLERYGDAFGGLLLRYASSEGSHIEYVRGMTGSAGFWHPPFDASGSVAGNAWQVTAVMDETPFLGGLLVENDDVTQTSTVLMEVNSIVSTSLVTSVEGAWKGGEYTIEVGLYNGGERLNHLLLHESTADHVTLDRVDFDSSMSSLKLIENGDDVTFGLSASWLTTKDLVLGLSVTSGIQLATDGTNAPLALRYLNAGDVTVTMPDPDLSSVTIGGVAYSCNVVTVYDIDGIARDVLTLERVE